MGGCLLGIVEPQHKPLGLQGTLTTQSAVGEGGTRAASLSMEQKCLGWRTVAALTAPAELRRSLPRSIVGALRRGNGTNT